MRMTVKHFSAGILAAALAATMISPARAQFADQSKWGICGGSANAQTIALPNVDSLAHLVGVSVACNAGAANTGATTLQVNSLSAIPVKKPAPGGLAALSGGEINGPIVYLYDGSEFVITGANYSQVIPPHNTWTQTVHGTYTFTVPAGIYWINATVVGGGGGGGPGGGGAFNNFCGGGGAGGGTAQGWLAVQPGQTITAVVGQGGAGGAGVNGIGGTGGTSTFASLSATGGTGGALAPGLPASAAGGSGGVGTGGQLNLTGGNGGDGNTFTTLIQGGAGGASSQGGGGRTSTIGLPGLTIVNGQAPGSGGGGVWGPLTTNNGGGNGADGEVVVSY